MVDFHNENTVSTPAAETRKVIILERRYNLFESLEEYWVKSANNVRVDTSFVQARLRTVFLELYAVYKEKKKPEEFESFSKRIFTSPSQGNTVEGLLQLVFDLEVFLNELNLTKIDTRNVGDRKNVERTNKEAHL